MFPALPTAFRPKSIEVHRLSLDAERHVRDEAETRGPAQPSGLPAGASAAIGSFDGVHLGHRQVIGLAVEAAKRENKPAAVICFDPHPQDFFRPDGGPFHLMDLSQQLRAFEALGVGYAYVLAFDARMSQLSPEDFARLVLRDQLKLSHIAAGSDFHFGRKGEGKANDLAAFGQTLGFTADILPLQTDADGNKLSSTHVRQALLAGDIVRANAILGHPQAYLGTVDHGAKLGRTIDFPTLNLTLGRYQRPRYGIYVTETALPDGRVIAGVSNIGVRPTVGGDIELLETYLFDFSEEIYGQTVETRLLDFIRPEAKFDSIEALRVAIQDDAARARAWFKRR